MGAANEAASVTAPRTLKVLRLEVSTTELAFVIPADFAGRPCTWMMEGADADVVFGLSTVTAVLNQVSSVTDGVITPHAGTGLKLKDGVKDYWVMPSIDASTTHFSVDASASGTLVIAISG
jgi:hypothetical protein